MEPGLRIDVIGWEEKSPLFKEKSQMCMAGGTSKGHREGIVRGERGKSEKPRKETCSEEQ